MFSLINSKQNNKKVGALYSHGIHPAFVWTGRGICWNASIIAASVEALQTATEDVVNLKRSKEQEMEKSGLS